MAEPPPELSGPAYLRLVGVGAMIGVPAALVAAVFLALVDDGSTTSGRICRARSAMRRRRGTW